MTLTLVDEKSGRVPFTWVSFADARGDIDGFATGWFFWVHESFKPALDIYFLEAIDKEKTNELRERMALKLFGRSHEAIKAEALASKRKLADCPEHQAVMAYKHTLSLATQGSPLRFSFRATDSLESRCANWYVQVTQAAPANQESEGEVGFQLFRRSAGHAKFTWERISWHSTTQADFVELLRFGVCNELDLTSIGAEPGVDKPLLVAAGVNA